MLSGIEDQLLWYKRNSVYKTTPEDRMVAKLVYGADKSEMGLVCETVTGSFWCFTTNKTIACMPAEEYLKEYDTPEKACDALYDYVLSEVYRLIRINSIMPYEVLRRFKTRDRDACEKYSKAALLAACFRCRESFAEIFKIGFKAGADWILRSEGIERRRPSWAMYLVQNRNGSFMWFEEQPIVNYNTGLWEAASGRSKPVAVEAWSKTLTRLT